MVSTLVGMNFSMVMTAVTGILLYVLVPGIALSLALFPRRGVLDFTERLGLSLFLGMSTPVIQYFNDKNLMIPITTDTTLATLAVVTVIGLVVWRARLMARGRSEVSESSVVSA